MRAINRRPRKTIIFRLDLRRESKFLRVTECAEPRAVACLPIRALDEARVGHPQLIHSNPQSIGLPPRPLDGRSQLTTAVNGLRPPDQITKQPETSAEHSLSSPRSWSKGWGPPHRHSLRPCFHSRHVAQYGRSSSTPIERDPRSGYLVATATAFARHQLVGLHKAHNALAAHVLALSDLFDPRVSAGDPIHGVPSQERRVRAPDLDNLKLVRQDAEAMLLVPSTSEFETDASDAVL